MIEEWFSMIELPLTMEQFHRLPQNPAYKYEYFSRQAWLTPRPKTYHGLLDLAAFVRPIKEVATQEEVSVRPLDEADWPRLPPIFAAAFFRVQPFASLSDEARLEAAAKCLRETREGAEGPLVAEACRVACGSEGDPVGAIITTLLPDGDLAQWGPWRWQEPPPPDAIARRIGRPHLTWVFVSPWFSRQGVGMAMLDEVVESLRRLGCAELASSFLLGNESSTLWHWRAGFRLISYPGSMRRAQAAKPA